MSVTITEERLKYLEALEAQIPELLEIRDKYKKLIESSSPSPTPSPSPAPEDTTSRIFVSGRSLGYRQRGYVTRSTLRPNRPVYNTVPATSTKPIPKPYFGQGKPQHNFYGGRSTFRRIPVRMNRT